MTETYVIPAPKPVHGNDFITVNADRPALCKSRISYLL